MNRDQLFRLRLVILFFVLLNSLFIAGRRFFESRGVDQSVLVVGNLLLFLVTLISFVIATRSLKSQNPQAFVRAMYVNVMIKLFVCIIAAFIYLRVAGKETNKPALFICMGLYVVYTVLEVATLTKLLRGLKKNA